MSPTHDLRGVMALERANVPGLHTLATVLVTYGGARYIAQSIIPGILQAEVSSKLVYGSVDNGNTVAADADMLAKVQRALAGMHVAERVVTPLAALSGAGSGGGNGSAMSDNAAGGGAGDAGDAADAAPTSDAATVVATATATATAAGGADGLTRRGLCHRSCATAQPVRYIGPIEWKGVQGSDGRQYLLDIVRLTPRDPAYYDNRLHDMLRMMGKPVAKTPAETAAQFDAYAPEAEPLFRSVFENPYAALLRPELLHLYEMYIQNKAATGAATGADKAAAATAATATAATAVTVPPSMPAADETARSDGEDGSGSGAAPSAQPQLRLNVNVFTRFMRGSQDSVAIGVVCG
ncbi:hypothetical protein EON68_03845 [archaeon]|nr:MAG: hypothetical protein EON68_03845 [archaeon]